MDLSPRDVDTFLNPVFVPDFFLDLAGSQVTLSGGREAFLWGESRGGHQHDDDDYDYDVVEDDVDDDDDDDDDVLYS